MKKNLLEIKLIGLLICFVLYSTPHSFLYAQQVNTLGQVIAKSNAVLVDSHPVPSGTTILNGDRIQAANGPAVLSLVNGGRIELAQNSALSLQGSSDSVTISGLTGGARFYFPRSVSLTILTPKSVIKASASASPLSGSVVVEDDKVTVTSDKGEYSVEDKDTSKKTTVKDGETATVPDSNEPAAKSGSGKKKAAAAGGLLGLGKVGTAVIVAGVAAASVAIPVGIAVANSSDDTGAGNQGQVSASRP
jgi:ferric-dicitrate binding protein FerR (iron transport regulator)